MFKVKIPNKDEIRKTIKNNILKLFEKYNYNNLDYLIDEDLKSINDFVFDIPAEDITGEGIYNDIINTILYKSYYDSIIYGKHINIFEDIIKIIYLVKIYENKSLFNMIYTSKDWIFINSYSEDVTIFIFDNLKLSNEEYNKINNDMRDYILSEYNIDLKEDSFALLFCKVLNDIIIREIESFTEYNLKEIREESIHRKSSIY